MPPVTPIHKTKRAKIEAAIDVGLAEADRGEGIPVEDVLEYLRKR